jgi:hypothetical protein
MLCSVMFSSIIIILYQTLIRLSLDGNYINDHDVEHVTNALKVNQVGLTCASLSTSEIRFLLLDTHYIGSQPQ